MSREFLTPANFKAELQVNDSAGTTGQLFTSAGPGLPPTWGARITFGTAAPSGGSDGDIYLQYT